MKRFQITALVGLLSFGFISSALCLEETFTVTCPPKAKVQILATVVKNPEALSITKFPTRLENNLLAYTNINSCLCSKMHQTLANRSVTVITHGEANSDLINF